LRQAWEAQSIFPQQRGKLPLANFSFGPAVHFISPRPRFQLSAFSVSAFQLLPVALIAATHLV